jgi:hypothetical protein
MIFTSISVLEDGGGYHFDITRLRISPIPHFQGTGIWSVYLGSFRDNATGRVQRTDKKSGECTDFKWNFFEASYVIGSRKAAYGASEKQKFFPS